MGERMQKTARFMCWYAKALAYLNTPGLLIPDAEVALYLMVASITMVAAKGFFRVLLLLDTSQTFAAVGVCLVVCLAYVVVGSVVHVATKNYGLFD